MTLRRQSVLLALLTGTIGCNRIDYPSGPLPTAPPLPPLAEPVSRAIEGRSVLLFFDEQRLVPLFCHDHGRRLLGADCAALLPTATGGDLHLSGGLVAQLGTVGESRCSWKGTPLPSYATKNTSVGSATATAALWSDTSYPLLSSPPLPSEIMPRTPSQQRGMKAACSQLAVADGSAPVVELVATWNVDLDGDGVRERLDELRCIDERRLEVIGQSVVVTAGRHPERTVPMRAVTDKSSTVQPIAVADVDSNGVPEVVIKTASPDRIRIELGHLDGVGLSPIVEVECLVGQKNPPGRVPARKP